MTTYTDKPGKPFPHINRGRQGLTYLVDAYAAGKVRGGIAVAVVALVAGAVYFFHATTGLVLTGLIPVAALAVAWNQRYARRVASFARSIATRNFTVNGVHRVTYLPQGKLYGRPILNPTGAYGGLRDEPFEATCLRQDAARLERSS